MTKGAVLLGDFGSIESKELVERQIFNEIKPKIGSWRNRCYVKNLQSPYKTASFRTLVYPKPKHENEYDLLEGIKPDPTGKLTYIERIQKVHPKGFYAEYTDEDLTFGFDNIVDDLKNSIVHDANYVLDEVAAKPWFNGNNVVTCATGLTREDFIKIRINLKKFTTNKNAVVKAILTPEDIAALRLKYNVAGANLFQDLPANGESVIEGQLHKFEGVLIEEDDSEYMYQTDGTTGEIAKNARYALFYITDSKGRSPVGLIKTDGTNGEFINKGLGSAGTGDPLNQKGSFGVKWKGLGSMLTAEECLVRVEISGSGVETVISGYDDYGNITAMGNKVERSGVRGTPLSSAKMLTIVAAGNVIKGKTKLNLKAFDETGTDVTTSVTWSSGTATVATVGAATGVVTGVANGTSVITAKKTGYLDQTFTVVVKGVTEGD